MQKSLIHVLCSDYSQAATSTRCNTNHSDDHSHRALPSPFSPTSNLKLIQVVDNEHLFVVIKSPLPRQA